MHRCRHREPPDFGLNPFDVFTNDYVDFYEVDAYFLGADEAEDPVPLFSVPPGAAWQPVVRQFLPNFEGKVWFISIDEEQEDRLLNEWRAA